MWWLNAWRAPFIELLGRRSVPWHGGVFALCPLDGVAGARFAAESQTTITKEATWDLSQAPLRG